MSAKPVDATNEVAGGAFVRTDATARDHISKGGKYEPEGARAAVMLRALDL